jgi:hypothetical protein
MKPFDLKKALAGEPVVTRDGRPVKIAGYNEDAKEYWHSLLGWADGVFCTWNLCGSHYTTSGNRNDLFMATTERVEWVVVYESNDGGRKALLCECEAVAKVFADVFKESRSATIHKITISE